MAQQLHTSLGLHVTFRFKSYDQSNSKDETTVSIWMLCPQLCPTLWNHVDCSSPGFPVLQYTQSLLTFMPIESVMPSNHLILCHPLLLLPSIFPSIRVFSNESALRIKWPKNWSFSFSISPYNEHQDWSPLGLTGLISLQSTGLLKSLC